MAVYTVLEAPDGTPEKAVFVREGFAVWAFLFTFFWALWHRMWIVAAVLFTVFAALNVAVNFEVMGAGLAGLLHFGVALIFGFEARSLRILSLEKSGYRRTGLIKATALEAAELTYFAARAPASTQQPAQRYRAEAEDTLGLFGNV